MGLDCACVWGASQIHEWMQAPWGKPLTIAGIIFLKKCKSDHPFPPYKAIWWLSLLRGQSPDCLDWYSRWTSFLEMTLLFPSGSPCTPSVQNYSSFLKHGSARLPCHRTFCFLHILLVFKCTKKANYKKIRAVQAQPMFKVCSPNIKSVNANTLNTFECLFNILTCLFHLEPDILPCFSMASLHISAMAMVILWYTFISFFIFVILVLSTASNTEVLIT